ncbi:hypothetical protein SLE2022_216650 [Rubroshorea leprosula]
MELSRAGNHDKRDLSIAENGQLARLLEQTVSTLRIGNLPVRGVLNELDLDLPSSHSDPRFFLQSSSVFLLHYGNNGNGEKGKEKVGCIAENGKKLPNRRKAS